MNTVAADKRLDLPDAADAAPPKSRRKLAFRIALGAACLLGIIYGIHWWTTGRFIEDTDDAYVGGDITVIGPKVSGYIVALNVTDNQQVHAGDVLIKIDDRDYRAALAKAQGAVAAQQALLTNLDATEQLQRAVIAETKASIAAAKAETDRAHDDDVRYRNLAGRAAVSIESAQTADAADKVAQANLEKAQAAWIAAQRQLDVIASQKQQARAALTQAKAERDLAALNVGYTELRAPLDGVIGNRRARVGAYAAAGTQLLSVVPAHGLWVDANFKEDQLARMQPGQPVTIHADVLPGRHFHGRVLSLAPATGAEFSVLPPENATGNFTKIVQRAPVRVALDEKDGALGLLRPGLSVVVDVDTHASSHSAP